MLVDYVSEWDSLPFRLGTEPWDVGPQASAIVASKAALVALSCTRAKVYATVDLDSFRRIVCSAVGDS